MKKIYTLLAVCMTALTLSAQSEICFVDAQGKEIADGAVVVMNDVETNDFDETFIPLKGLSIKNKSNAAKQVRLSVKVEEWFGSSLACCVGSTCKSLYKAGSLAVEGIAIAAGNAEPITHTEWIVNTEEYGTFNTQFVLETQKGTTNTQQTAITVQFVYADPASLPTAQEVDVVVVKTFDLTGRETNAQKGILLQVLSDGTTRKVIK